MAPRFFNPFPKYLQIRHLLLRRLAAEYAEGDQLPSEPALSAEFGVSRETIRDALRGLEEEGLILRERGRGTRVLRRPAPGEDERHTGLIEDFIELKLDTYTQVLEAGAAEPPPRLASWSSDAASLSYHICQVRYLDETPLAHHETWLPETLGEQIAARDVSRTTIMHTLKHELAVNLWEDHHEVDAVAAGPGFADALDVPVGAPLLVIRRYYVIAEDHPIAYFETCFRSDRYYYTVQLVQGE